MNYRLHHGALDEATYFYFQEDPNLEARFAAYVDEAIEQVTRHPRSWPVIEAEIRRYILNVFPYSLLYSIEEDYILILAIAHQSRDPKYWRDRLN